MTNEHLAGIGTDELTTEKDRFEFELEVVLAEIEEFREFSERLPTLKSEFLAMSENSRAHSVRIYAKLNALDQAIALLKHKKALDIQSP